MQSAAAIRCNAEPNLIGFARGIQIKGAFGIVERRGERLACEHDIRAIRGIVRGWAGKIAYAERIVREQLGWRKSIRAEFAAGQGQADFRIGIIESGFQLLIGENELRARDGASCSSHQERYAEA